MKRHRVSRPDLTDEQIEAIVTEAIAAEAADARQEAAPPSSAIVWWRAQMRARQEAARLAERPIAVVHALSIAAGVGVMLGVLGYAIAAMKGSWGWLAGAAQSTAAAVAAVAGAWTALTLTTTLFLVIAASVAAYVALSE
jgi:hypothetical protein